MKWWFCILLVTGCVATKTTMTPGSEPASTQLHGGDQLVRLGEKIFNDPMLSNPPGQACVSCHDPERAFTGNFHSPVTAIPLGSDGHTLGNRNVPTIMYALFSPAFSFIPDPDEPQTQLARGGQFWDGRAATLLEQVQGPLLNPKEMNNRDLIDFIARLRKSPTAAELEAVYGADIWAKPEEAMAKVAEAVVAFESSPVFHPFSSRFDRYLRGELSLTPLEEEGFALFKDPQKGNCLACHAGNPDSREPSDWLFTDFSYDNLGVPRNKTIPDNKVAEAYDLGLCAQPGLASKLPKGVELNSLCGAFKVPTLRNIAKTAPYMHNGHFQNLKDVVRFYATRDTKPRDWYPHGRDGAVAMFDDVPAKYRENVNRGEAPYDRKLGQLPRLNDHEITAIVAFLETLTDTN